MCVGIPLCVLAVEDQTALGRNAENQLRYVNLALLDHAVEVGDWILVHGDTALYSLTPEEAAHISDALQAVALAARGEPFEHLLRDLIDREPQLPPHLRT